MSELRQRLKSALTDRRWDDYDEVWLDFIEEEKATVPECTLAAKDALAANEGTRAGLPLSLLVPQVNQLPAKDRIPFYEALVGCLPAERDHREALLRAYEEEYGEVDGITVFLKTCDLKRTEDPRTAIGLFHRMIHFRPGTFVFHRSGWGVGEISELLPLEGTAIINFEGKPGHRVKVDAIPDICDQLPDDHLLVLAWKDPERLRSMASEAPLELVKSALRTSEKPMSLTRIREMLVGKAIPSSEWSKWWARQRNALKKDSQIGIGAGKTSTFFLLEGAEDKESELVRRMTKQDMKGRLRILRETITEAPTVDRDIIEPYMKRLRRDLNERREPLGTRLESWLFLRRHDLDTESLPDLDAFLVEVPGPAEAMNAIHRNEDQAELIDLLRIRAGEDWPRLHKELLLASDDGPRGILLDLLKQADRLEELAVWGSDVNRVAQNAPLFYLYLTRLAARRDLQHFPALTGIPPIDFVKRCISLLNEISLRAEHEDHPAHELFVKRVRHVLGGKPLAVLEQAMDNASISACRELYNQVEASRGFTGIVRQRMLAALLRRHPELLSSTEKREVGQVDESSLYATDEGILKKRLELEDLRNEKLPAIYKAIREAAAMGDISENAEFSSAIEERENLNRRVMELQALLDKVQRIDLSQVAGDRVSLGSRVTLIELATGERQSYSVLGPWDGDPEAGVVSYLSPLGRAVMDCATGDEFEVQLPAGKNRYRLEAISIHEEASAGSG